MNSKNKAYLGNAKLRAEAKGCAEIKTKYFQEIIDDMRLI